MRIVCSWVALALLLGGCAPKNDEEAAEVWAFGAIRDNARTGDDTAGIDSRILVDFRGQPIRFRSPPYSDTVATQDPSVDGAAVIPAFAEGAPAAYLATDIWYDRSPVWVQPVYVPVTAWNPQHPFKNLLPGAKLVFGVGPTSSFYSPYWRFQYVEVPANTDPGTLTNVRALLDLNTPVHPGGLWMYSLVPTDVAVSAPAGGTPIRPLNGDSIMPVKVSTGWVEGQLTGVFDYGLDTFSVNDDDEVGETPLFEFAVALSDGGMASLGLPKVGGVAPLYSGQAANLKAGVPQFGSLWRNYLVALPSNAAVFVPPEFPELRSQIQAQGLIQVPDVGPIAGADPRAKDYALRVALDSRCFSDDAGFPDGCTWLDSQAAVEAAIPEASIVETEVTLTCPFLEYGGTPVPGP